MLPGLGGVGGERGSHSPSLFLLLSSPSSKGVSSPTAPAPGTDFSYLANSHWNSQTLVRLNAHERDHLSRDETQLVSCFAVHPNKKMLAFAEYSTEMRLVTITIADIHAASEEEFTQMDIGSERNDTSTSRQPRIEWCAIFSA